MPAAAAGQQQQGKSTSARRKPDYAGGLVLEPKRGLYDTCVLVLDFNSLYPSIIMEFNICFTTVVTPEGDAMPDRPPMEPAGILPAVIKTLVDRRKQVKELLKSETNELRRQQYDIRQKAIKLLTNSMYGCLGFRESRFYARPLAQLVTYQGRDILTETYKLVTETLGFDVVYGDTDSIMIDTKLKVDNLPQIMDIGLTIKKRVNQRYKKLEIDIDGIFERILLLRKKKYGAIKLERIGGPSGDLVRKVEMKGLDMVRRDWSLLSKKAGEQVLGLILSELDRETVVERVHELLRQLGEDMRAGKLDLDDFVITKGLTKRPEDYPDAKNQPHVQVALKMLAAGKTVHAGDHIPYVICEGPAPGVADRAYHKDEVLNSRGNLVLDYDWYLRQQIHPPVERLCDPVEGTDAAQLAACLGLDPTKFKSSPKSDAAANDEDALAADDEERYKDCEPYHVVCTGCLHEAPFAGIRAKPGVAVSPFACPGCSERYNPHALVNQLALRIRAAQQTYYDGWHVCDNPDVRCFDRLFDRLLDETH